METLFISDLHLEDEPSQALEQLLDFLSGPARGADAVYILGDLFEYWIGDDAAGATALAVAQTTAWLVSSGVPCHFMHGNRDFLLGEDYAARAGLTLLPESVVVDLYGEPTLLLHGDTLCTDDVEYQAVRQQVRNPAWQAGVLALPVEERLRMAHEARDASADHTAGASAEIMDVNHDTVMTAFKSSGVRRMIHGHTHRPGTHRYESPEGEAGTVLERIVLADWYKGGSYLEVRPSGIRSVDL